MYKLLVLSFVVSRFHEHGHIGYRGILLFILLVALLRSSSVGVRVLSWWRILFGRLICYLILT